MIGFSGMFSFQRRSTSNDLLDRAGLAKLAHQEMQRSALSGTPLALMLVEIDHFEHLRAAGAADRVLNALAAVLTEHCGLGGAVARLRAQEFAVLLPERSTEELAALGELIRATTSESITNNHGSPVTVSVGVGMHYPGEANWMQMLSRADLALFCAKSGGANRVVMDTGSTARNAVEQERRANMLQTAA